MVGVVLRWQRALIEDLVEKGPPNHTRIAAVAAAMVIHANADGTRMEAGLRSLARETGQRHGRVGEAIEWLLSEGWMSFERRIARGGRRFTLTFPQRPATGHADTESRDTLDRPSVPPRDTLYESSVRSASRHGTQTSDLRPP